MKRDIAAIQIIIRKAENELDRIIALLAKRDGVLKDSDVTCLLLFRKIIEKIDAIFILHDNGHQSSSDSLARDAFENYVYLAFMIRERYEYRALAYQFQNLKMQLDLLELFEVDSRKGKQFRSLLNIKNNKVPPQFKERKLYLEKRIKEEPFSNIQVDWKRKEKNKRKSERYPTWYNISGGKKNVADICRFLNMEDEYHTFYSLFSHQVHSLNALSQLIPVNGQGAFKPIREDVDSSLPLALAESIAIRSLLLIIGHFDATNLEVFNTWHSKEYPKEVREEMKSE